MRPTEVERFWSKVDAAADGCWVWTASCDRDGYGKFWGGGRVWRSHIWSFAFFGGTIRDGLVLDHVLRAGCTNRHCVNPAHLEAVTPVENMRRGGSPPVLNTSKTHCPREHPLSGDNLVTDRAGKRKCRTCKSGADRRYRDRQRGGPARQGNYRRVT